MAIGAMVTEMGACAAIANKEKSREASFGTWLGHWRSEYNDMHLSELMLQARPPARQGQAALLKHSPFLYVKQVFVF